MAELDDPPLPWQIRFAGKAPLAPKAKAKLKSKIDRWISDGSWQLWEGCCLVHGAWPDRDGKFFAPIKHLRASGLLDRAERDARVGKLRIGNPNDKPKDWWATPIDFLRWAAARPSFVGDDRAKLLGSLIPQTAFPEPTNNERKKVLESATYVSTEFDMACAAIVHFWLDAKEDEEFEGNTKTVEKWLRARYQKSDHPDHRMPTAQIDRIVTLIRPDWAKRMESKSSPKKSAKK